MRLLFVHQNFPSQYQHILHRLAQQGGHQLVAIGMRPSEKPLPPGIEHHIYSLGRGNTPGIHRLVVETESKVLRGEACAELAHQLRLEGFEPDLICAHPGWGETLFLRQVWPKTPILSYQEFYYRLDGFDHQFDPEIQPPSTWQDQAKVWMKNANVLLGLEASTWNIAPTLFQRSSFPSHWQQRISTIHDGVDTTVASPSSKPLRLKLSDDTLLTTGMPVVTFVNRSLEPYRGCHTMLRAIPELQQLQPNAHLVIVGETTGVSYGAPCPQGEWREHFLRDIEGQYDPSRVHYTGSIPHQQLIALLRISTCHVYLTYPFVLSWSLLEAMSCGCAVVGSATEPVQEVIDHGQTGLLVDFFSPSDLAAAISELLSNRDLAQRLGAAARTRVLRDYSLDVCVPRQLELMNLVARGVIGN